MGFSSSGTGIANATDVAISSPGAGDFLGWNNGVGKWQDIPLAGSAALATGGGQETIVTTNSTTTTTLNLANGNVFNVTLVGNTTIAFSGATNGTACAISLYLRQDATGNRTVTWPSSSTLKWAGGAIPSLTTTANAVDILVFETLNGGTTWFGSLVGANFS
ncbi:MAG: hypothetical protein WBP26_04270 [Candidatus Saccharimonadales bacterium]